MTTAARVAHPDETGRSWRVDLPFTAPISLNGRGHWQTRARQIAHIRRGSLLVIRAARVPALPRISVELHYAPRDRRRRDPLNLVATLKPLEDAIVDAGVVPDDTPAFVLPTMPVIDPPTGASRGALYVVIRELRPEAAA